MLEGTTETRRWLEEFGGLLGNRIQDMIGVDGISKKELTPYFYPSDKDIEKVALADTTEASNETDNTVSSTPTPESKK